MGTNYAIIGIDDLALKNMLKALKYLNQYNPSDQELNKSYIWIKKLLLSNITEIDLDQKNLPMAIQYHKQSLDLNKIMPPGQNSKNAKISELDKSSQISHLQGDDLATKKYLEEGIRISREIANIDKESSFLTALGGYEKDVNKKILYLEKSYELTNDIKISNTYSIHATLVLIDTYVSILTDRPAGLSAKYTDVYLSTRTGLLLTKVKKDIALIGSKNDLAETYRLYSKFESWKKNYKSAHQYSEEFHYLIDSIYSQENKNKLAALQSAYDIELRYQQIAINKATIKEKEKQTWILVIGLALVSILVALLFYQNRLRKRKNEELDQANRIKTRFFSILNHDLRSPIGDLITYLNIKKTNAGILDLEMQNRLDNQTTEAVENLLIVMEDLLVWSKGQMDNFKIQTKKTSITKLFNYIDLNFSVKENIRFQFENPDNIKLYTDKNCLKTILRNLTSNAVKALDQTDNATIIWKAYTENGKTIISITDNGPGSNSEEFRALYDETVAIGIKSGLGLHLVRDMANALGCTVKVASELRSGTTIKLIFK